MKYGYKRPIVSDKQCEKQLKGLSVDTVLTESHGLAKERVALEKVLMTIQPGDELFVQNIVVLVDSLQHFIDVLRLAERDNIIVHFIDETLTNKTIQHQTLLESTTFFATLQSTFLSHSSTFTLRAAKEQGKSIGRPRKSDVNLQRAFTMYDSNDFTLFEIKQVTGISKSTLYRYLDERE